MFSIISMSAIVIINLLVRNNVIETNTMDTIVFVIMFLFCFIMDVFWISIISRIYENVKRLLKDENPPSQSNTTRLNDIENS